ncbi:MAG: sulfotransferase family protein [Omnitrophica WOR_2 bacterium]
MPETRFDSLRRRLAQKILRSLPLTPLPPELELITPDQLAEVKQFFSLPKFFIFGYPRSGTTLLMRLVSLHPQVYCGREAHFFTKADDATRVFADQDIRRWLEKKSNRWTAGQDMSTPVVRALIDFILEREARRCGKTVVGDKTPNSNGKVAVQRLHAVYPDARLIYIVRDGRDAALSHRFQHFIDHPEYLTPADLHIRDDFARDSVPYFHKQRSVFTPEALQKEAAAWSKNVMESDLVGQELFGAQYFSLCYESLLANPAAEMRRLWSFLGVEPGFPEAESLVLAKMTYNPGAEAQQKKESALSRNLPRGRQGSWKEIFTPRDCAVFKQHAGEALVRWGYEKDLNW